MLNFSGSNLNTTPLGSRGLGSTGPVAAGGLPAIAYGQAAQRVPYSYPSSGAGVGPFSSALRDQQVAQNPGIPEGWQSQAYDIYNKLSPTPISPEVDVSGQYYYGQLGKGQKKSAESSIPGSEIVKVKIKNRAYEAANPNKPQYVDGYYFKVPVANAPANLDSYYINGKYQLMGDPAMYNKFGMVKGYADGGIASAYDVSPEMLPPGQPEVQSDPQDEQFITLALEAIDPASGMPDQQRQIILEEFEKRYGEGAVEELMRQFEEAQEVPIDDIPAMLTEGEVVIPRDAVKGADPNGNGNVEAGARELMSMVDELRNVRGGEAAMPPAARQGIAAALGGR